MSDTSSLLMFNEFTDADMLQGKAPCDHIDRIGPICHYFLHIHITLIEIFKELAIKKYALDVF